MRIRELIKKYDGKTVVDSVSFELPKGRVTSFIGPNGAGKSTVMGIISRLIQRDSGRVEFENRDIGSWKSRELSRRLAILTQGNNIQMKLTVEELVAFGRFPYSGGRLTAEDRILLTGPFHIWNWRNLRNGLWMSCPADSAREPTLPWSLHRIRNISC